MLNKSSAADPALSPRQKFSIQRQRRKIVGIFPKPDSYLFIALNRSKAQQFGLNCHHFSNIEPLGKQIVELSISSYLSCISSTYLVFISFLSGYYVVLLLSSSIDSLIRNDGISQALRHRRRNGYGGSVYRG